MLCVQNIFRGPPLAMWLLERGVFNHSQVRTLNLATLTLLTCGYTETLSDVWYRAVLHSQTETNPIHVDRLLGGGRHQGSPRQSVPRLVAPGGTAYAGPPLPSCQHPLPATPPSPRRSMSPSQLPSPSQQVTPCHLAHTPTHTVVPAHHARVCCKACVFRLWL